MAQQGKVSSFEASVTTASGSKETRSVVRVGTFNLLSGDKFLTYGKGGVTESPRQPAGQYTSQAGALAAAGAGSAVNFALDPTQGTLLGAAVENPSIPNNGPVGIFPSIVGPPPVAVSTNKVPIIGPVHEKETNANVPAIKKMPNRPPLSAALSVLFTQEDGSVSSKNPKNENANTTRSMKNTKLKYGLTAISFKMVGPNAVVNPIPTTTYMTIIDMP